MQWEKGGSPEESSQWNEGKGGWTGKNYDDMSGFASVKLESLRNEGVGVRQVRGLGRETWVRSREIDQRGSQVGGRGGGKLWELEG